MDKVCEGVTFGGWEGKERRDQELRFELGHGVVCANNVCQGVVCPSWCAAASFRLVAVLATAP